jgi:hypothetical protein
VNKPAINVEYNVFSDFGRRRGYNIRSVDGLASMKVKNRSVPAKLTVVTSWALMRQIVGVKSPDARQLRLASYEYVNKFTARRAW